MSQLEEEGIHLPDPDQEIPMDSEPRHTRGPREIELRSKFVDYRLHIDEFLFHFHGRSLLSTAIFNGHYEVCDLLLSHGAKETLGCESETLLERAVRSKRDDLVKLLVDNGFDIHRRSLHGPLLRLVAQCGTLPMAMLLVERGLAVDERERCGATRRWELTPLEIACFSPNSAEIAIYLATKTASIDTKHSLALHLAALSGKANVIRKFVSLGATVDAELPDHTIIDATPLKAQDTPLLSTTRDCINGEFSSLFMFFADKMQGLEALLDRGANPNVRGADNRTPLQLAVEEPEGQVDEKLVVNLVEHGADMTSNFEDGTTVLQMACRRCPMNIVKFLLERGAPVNHVSGPWRTALFAAYEKKPTPKTLFSLNSRTRNSRADPTSSSDITLEDDNHDGRRPGRTPGRTQRDLYKRLMDTPLLLAPSQNNSVSVIQLLLHARANFRREDYEGMGPECQDDIEILETLVEIFGALSRRPGKRLQDRFGFGWGKLFRDDLTELAKTFIPDDAF
jgi:ankyrin repeat protein